jgi:hypothetical protein
LELFIFKSKFPITFFQRTQQYPPGTQNNYVGFMNLFVITETGKELNTLKGGGGYRGNRWFPLKGHFKNVL